MIPCSNPAEPAAADEFPFEHMPLSPLEPVLLVPGAQIVTVWDMLQKAGCTVQFWQLGGRFGGRIRSVDGDMRRGIPLTPATAACIAEPSPQCGDHCHFIRSCIQRGEMEIRLLKPLPSKRVPRPEPHGDGTVHAERKTNFLLSLHTPTPQCSFTFVELFAGIGGFRQGLEALGGRCVLASEIDHDCVESYKRNYPSECALVGDICQVPSQQIPTCDILVGGFPCQPFSREGLQPGLEDKRGDGKLFLEIVRILRDTNPRAFLLENVPGLLTCDEGKAYAIIMKSLEVDGRYSVTSEIVNSRCLTAQSRNRVYIVGILRTKSAPSELCFQFPFIPDMGLRFVDVLETDEEINHGPSSRRVCVDDYTLSDVQFKRVQASHLWRTHGPNGRLAWSGKQCETLISNYGHSIGNGSSVLVPRRWPHNPRRLTPRECARLMGFPDSRFDVGEPSGSRSSNNNTTASHGGPNDPPPYPPANVWFKSHYRMFGNAVCPPVICAIGGALLQQCPGMMVGDWEAVGRTAAIQMALKAVTPARRDVVLHRLTTANSCSR